MDLRTAYPRSMRKKLAGHVHLARMLDKARAAQVGTLGEYIFPCPLDDRLLEFAGITADQFLEAVRGRNDEAMADWFRRTARPRSPEEIEAWNEMMLARGPETDEKRAYFTQLRDAIDPTRTDITSWADLLDLDEKRPVPIRSATTMTGAR